MALFVAGNCWLFAMGLFGAVLDVELLTALEFGLVATAELVESLEKVVGCSVGVGGTLRGFVV